MFDEKDDEMKTAIPQGLTPEEARDLQAELAPGEWQAMFAVQQTLAAAPAFSPAEGFAQRTLARLAVREREQARGKSALGAIVLVAGALFGGALLLISYGEAVWSQVGGPAGIVTAAVLLAGYLQTYFLVLSGLAAAVSTLLGDWPLVLLAVFAFGVALASVRLIGSAPASRPILEREA